MLCVILHNLKPLHTVCVPHCCKKKVLWIRVPSDWHFHFNAHAHLPPHQPSRSQNDNREQRRSRHLVPAVNLHRPISTGSVDDWHSKQIKSYDESPPSIPSHFCPPTIYPPSHAQPLSASSSPSLSTTHYCNWRV